MIVTNVAGTTHDAVDHHILWKGKKKGRRKLQNNDTQQQLITNGKGTEDKRRKERFLLPPH